MIKKTKLYIGISLIVQSFTFFVMFFMLWRQKKSIANTFFGAGLIGSITGAVLIYKTIRQDKRFKKMIFAMDKFYHGDFDNDGDFSIPVDDEATEDEFELSI
ncbi:MAG: hypothetical protein IJT91_02005 [Clostridia bacterium]|nr:hypothetical protein [Clostridia bacterium]